MRYSKLKELSGSELDDELKRQKILDLITRKQYREGQAYGKSLYESERGLDKHMAKIIKQLWIVIILGAISGVSMGYAVFFT